MKKIAKFFRESILSNSSPLVAIVGLCLVLASSTSLISGLSMGVLVTLVLVLSSVTVSLVGRFIPKSARVISYMVIIAFYVAMSELLLRAFLPVVYDSLGIYLPLIAVSGIVFSEVLRAESTPCGNAAFGALCRGISFFAVVAVMSFIREVLGQGTFFGLRIIPEEYAMRALVYPFGAFIVLGFLIAIFKNLFCRVSEKEGEK